MANFVKLDSSNNVTGMGTLSCAAITTSGNLNITSGFSIQGSGTAAITIDGSGEVTRIGQDSPSDGQYLKWDNSNSKVVWDTVSATGDITTSGNLTQNRIIKAADNSKAIISSGIIGIISS